MSKQNLTRIVGIWWVSLLTIAVMVNQAQDMRIEPDSPVTVSIGDSPAWLTYEAKAGETISITTLTAITDTAPDTTLEILYPDGQRLAYADDLILADGSVKSDAVLKDLRLPIDGLYRIRVDSFNGVSEGELEVLLNHPSEAFTEVRSENTTIVTVDLPKLEVFQYSLEVSAESIVSISAQDISGTLDPLLRIYDANGALIAFNDDHQDNNLSLDVLDAAVTDLAISEDTKLRISVSDYLGRSGSVDLIISS